MITTLIEDQDRSEIVKDKIADILVTELANQRTIATSEGKATTPWDIRVFVDRFEPFEGYLQPDDSGYDPRPVINITLDSATRSGQSTTEYKERYDGEFYIDCTALGVATGTTPADLAAKVRVQEVIRIVRNILRYGDYITLGLPSAVCQQRKILEITASGIGQIATQTVASMRIRMGVTYEEAQPYYQAEILETISVSTEISPSGEVILNTFNNGGL